jgi:putative membrane protein
MIYAVIAIGCAVAGCSQNNSNDNMAANDMMANDMMANDMMANDMMMNDAMGNATADAAAVDAAFVTWAMKGNNSEVAMGKMAQDKGGTQAVKDFGKMLVTDHSAANDKLEALAASANVPVTDALSDEAMAAKPKMEAMSGATFDAAFKTMAIEAHQKDIAKYEAQAKSNDAQTAAYAEATLPVLRKHLQTAEAL